MNSLNIPGVALSILFGIAGMWCCGGFIAPLIGSTHGDGLVAWPVAALAGVMVAVSSYASFTRNGATTAGELTRVSCGVLIITVIMLVVGGLMCAGGIALFEATLGEMSYEDFGRTTPWLLAVLTPLTLVLLVVPALATYNEATPAMRFGFLCSIIGVVGGGATGFFSSGYSLEGFGIGCAVGLALGVGLALVTSFLRRRSNTYYY